MILDYVIIGMMIILLISSLTYLIVNRESYGENNVQDIINDYKSMTYKGSDVSGSVWTNNDYNIAEEDPGLAWVL
jgi:hypothetical protein